MNINFIGMVIDDRPSFEPEQLLILRMIERAILDIVGDLSDLELIPSSKMMMRKRAAAWVTSRDIHAFSFDWCCRALGMDPDYGRTQVLEKSAYESKRFYGAMRQLRERPLRAGKMRRKMVA